MQLAGHYTRVLLKTERQDLTQELRDALSAPQKSLPCKWLYDATGSELFEQITQLPEYYLTRSEVSILERHAESLIALCPSPLSLVELGSGSSKKTRYLIEPCLRRQEELNYYAIDVSGDALDAGAMELFGDFDQLQFTGLCGEFEAGLRYLARYTSQPHLIAFLGSTIGNLDEVEIESFFKMLRGAMRPADRFLLGFDLLKDPSILLPAYDDAQGVTAQFNLNMLIRLNREFDANFDLANFEHRAVFNAQRSRIEMHIVCKRACEVSIPGLALELEFAAGETIHTENSYKHSREAMLAILQRHEFMPVTTVTDARGYFCLVLARCKR